MKKVMILLFCIIAGNRASVFSQDDVVAMEGNFSYSLVPHTPNGDVSQYVNVDLFHGTCHIDIPLCVLKSRTLSVAVSLSYVPPRISEPDIRSSGQVGAGWRLRAGGTITRTVRGARDETKKSESGNYIWPSNAFGETNTPDEDLFSFDFCGYSGTFFYYRGNTQYCYSSNSHIMAIYPFTNKGRNNELTGFKIEMIDGSVYTFGYGPINTIFDTNDGSKEGENTWYLSKIESADRTDYIHFYYKKMETAFSSGGYEPWLTTEAIYYNSNTYDYGQGTYYYTKNHELEKSTIITNGVYTKSSSYLHYITCSLSDVSMPEEVFTTVEFDYSAAEDQYYAELVNSGGNADKVQKLDRIRMMASTGTGGAMRCFKRFDLRYIENPNEPLKLLSVEETGIGANLQEKSLPSYQFSYNSIKLGTSIYSPSLEVLHKMIYPTGGFSVFEFGKHYHLREAAFPSTLKMGLRINKINSYSSEDEAPVTTHYQYPLPYPYYKENSGELSRTEMKERTFGFEVAYSGYVDWKQTSNFDLYSTYSHMPAPNVIGYSHVKVTKGTGDHAATTTEYEFSNHSGNYPLHSDGQRRFYCQVGQLLRKDDSFSKYEYSYDDPDRNDTLYYSYTEYYPFEFRSGVTYSKKKDYKDSTIRYASKPKEVLTYKYGYLVGKKTCSYHPNTQQLVREEFVDVVYKKKEEIADSLYRDVYVTEYNYPDFITHISRRMVMNAMKEPYEVVKKKNGKVVEASITRFAYVQCNGEYVFRPEKVYRLAVSEPIDDYQYADPQYLEYTNTMVDPRCRLEVSYEYYPNGDLKKVERPGREPVCYEWDACRRLLSKREGDMKVSYTYGLFGVISKTAPDGRMYTNEYDILGRLSVTRDEDGNVVQAIDYEYGLSD